MNALIVSRNANLREQITHALSPFSLACMPMEHITDALKRCRAEAPSFVVVDGALQDWELLAGYLNYRGSAPCVLLAPEHFNATDGMEALMLGVAKIVLYPFSEHKDDLIASLVRIGIEHNTTHEAQVTSTPTTHEHETQNAEAERTTIQSAPAASSTSALRASTPATDRGETAEPPAEQDGDSGAGLSRSFSFGAIISRASENNTPHTEHRTSIAREQEKALEAHETTAKARIDASDFAKNAPICLQWKDRMGIVHRAKSLVEMSKGADVFLYPEDAATTKDISVGSKIALELASGARKFGEVLGNRLLLKIRIANNER